MQKEATANEDSDLTQKVDAIMSHRKEGGYSCDFKIISQKQAGELIELLKQKGMSVVLVSGVFDLWHTGYLQLFDEARRYGDILGVATPTNEQIKENKNPQLPLTPLADRLALLSCNEMVDFTFPQDSWLTLDVLRATRPSTYAYLPWNNKQHMEKFINQATAEFPGVYLQKLNLDTSLSSSSKLRVLISKLK